MLFLKGKEGQKERPFFEVAPTKVRSNPENAQIRSWIEGLYRTIPAEDRLAYGNIVPGRIRVYYTEGTEESGTLRRSKFTVELCGENPERKVCTPPILIDLVFKLASEYAVNGTPLSVPKASISIGLHRGDGNGNKCSQPGEEVSGSVSAELNIDILGTGRPEEVLPEVLRGVRSSFINMLGIPQLPYQADNIFKVIRRLDVLERLVGIGVRDLNAIKISRFLMRTELKSA